MAERLSQQDLRKMEGPLETEVEFSLHSQTLDSDEELEDYDKIIRQEIEASNDLNEFLKRFEERKEQLESFQAFKLDARLTQLLGRIPSYDAETVQILDSIRYFDWERIDQLLEQNEELDTKETMYVNRLKAESKRRSPDQLADYALDHYRQKKRDKPDRVQSFESAARKIFGTAEFHPYQEVLAEVELLTEGYSPELERIIEDELSEENVESRREAYEEVLDALDVADDPEELAAYTQDRIEFLKDRRPEVAEQLEKIVMEEYEAALPTTPLHYSE